MTHAVIRKMAVAAALLGPVVAYAQTTSVQVYGIIDTGITYGKGGPKGSELKMDSGIQDVSRWGIRGQEDLGNGMAAIFKLEEGILTDTGASDKAGAMFSREASVGLISRFGTVIAGLQFTPMYKVLSPLTPFGNAFGGSPGQLMSGEKGGTRAANQIIYKTPEINNFRSEFAYSLGEVAGDWTASRQLGFSLSYGPKNTRIEFAHNQKNDATSTNVQKNELLTGRFDLGYFVTHLGFGVDRGPGNVNDRDLLVGVSKKFLGVHEIYFAYQHKNDLNGHFYNADEQIIDYSYTLSKRTNLYVAANRLSNIRFTTPKFSTGNREFDIGIRHRF